MLTWRCATPFVSSEVSECRRFGIKLEPSRKPASNPWTRNIDSRGQQLMLAPDKIVFLYGTKTSIPLLFLTKEIGEREYSMKITVATFSAILFVSGFSPLAHAQAQIAVPGVGEVTIGQPPPAPPPPGYGRAPQSEYAEHCDHLRHREHELRERVAYLPYGPERARLEHQLQEVQDERDQCWRR
jgi:hypothetical protein